LKNKEANKVLLTDAESGVVFEINATALREMYTRHGRNGNYSEVRTDFETFRVKEDITYICTLAAKEKNKAEWILAKLAMIHRPAALLDIEQILDKVGGRLDYYYFWLVKGGIS
jgi:hypothetical protein